MRALPLAAILALAALPLVAAQAPADGDYDTAPPADDDAYTGDASASSAPSDGESVSDADYDTAPPAADESYLADEGAPAPVPDAPADTTTDGATGSSDATIAPPAAAAKTPGLDLVALVGAAALVALVARRAR